MGQWWKYSAPMYLNLDISEVRDHYRMNRDMYAFLEPLMIRRTCKRPPLRTGVMILVIGLLLTLIPE